jgi:hypothetical protein
MGILVKSLSDLVQPFNLHYHHQSYLPRAFAIVNFAMVFVNFRAYVLRLVDLYLGHSRKSEE